jgi:hypothetical protein
LDLLDLKERLDLLEQMVLLEHLVLLDQLVHKVLREFKVQLEQPVEMVHLGRQVEMVELVLLDHKVLREFKVQLGQLDLLVLRVLLEHVVLLVLRV